MLPGGGAPGRLLRYGDGPDQVAEYYPGTDPTALVLFVHGGFWRARYDRTHARPLAAALSEAGFAVLLPEYRRVGQPGGGWPGTLHDVATAVDELPAAVAPQLPLLVAGHSAGGHLALWAAARHHLPPDAPGARPAAQGIRGVLGLAPVADLASASRLGLGDGATDAFLGGSPADRPDRYAVADPTALPPPGTPVTVLHGLADDIVPTDVVRGYAADGRAEFVLLPGADHFGVITPGSEDWPHVVSALRKLADEAKGAEERQ
ncbi:alpha/beta hydrolase [Cryptosporangium minutisporangium]|uniref:Alpha/beta hydrolase n=2 Tax=Cryptosporangium minutisporangium TaxID=113569 RepID=A0ABP6SXW6_9ACTN